jgi:NAD(P)-dependent dehydrogenase (short-subunit alcohol dehydrogenase family)
MTAQQVDRASAVPDSAADPVGDVLGRLFDVRDRVVLVTGGASGLGLAIADVLVRCGATVVIADRDEDALAAADPGTPHPGTPHPGTPHPGTPHPGRVERAVVDVSDAAAVADLVDGIVGRHGRLDAAFANAGIARGRGPNEPAGQIDAFSLSDWHALLDVNMHGVLHTVRAAATPMKRQRGGSIIVTASTAGLRQDPFVSYSYVVAKAGVINLVRQAALDLARWRVRVNAIAPGPFRTNIGGRGPIPDSVAAQWNATVPLGRMGDPGEIAGLALLLASGASSFMTGGVYLVDGGQSLQSLPLPEAR